MSANENGKQSFWTTLPGILTGCAGVIGAIATLIGASYAAGLLGGGASTPSPAAVTVIAYTQIVQPIPVSTEITIPPLILNSTATPDLAPLPQESGCPSDTRAQWLPYRDTWYGPWDGFSILYDLYNFYVYDPNQWNAQMGTYGLQSYYPIQFARNTWTELLSSPFWVCIDIPGNVYVVYQP
jgi:hypothetical protein